MGTTQGNSLYSYLYLKLPKCHHVSPFIFYGFFSTKSENQEGGTGSAWKGLEGGQLALVGGRRDWKGVGG
jgi:hypothetical protein